MFGGAVDESFYVDYTVGRNLVFRIDYTQKSYLQGFNLKSPSGIIYTQLEYDDVAKVALFKLSEAEVIVLHSCFQTKKMEWKTIYEFTGWQVGF